MTDEQIQHMKAVFEAESRPSALELISDLVAARAEAAMWRGMVNGKGLEDEMNLDPNGKQQKCEASLFRRGDANAPCALAKDHVGEHVFAIDSSIQIREQQVRQIRADAIEEAVGLLDKAGLEEASKLLRELLRK